MYRRLTCFAVAAVFCLSPLSLRAQASGRIEGRIAHPDGWGIGGVMVEVLELNKATVSDTQGRYALDGIPAGTYTVSFSLGDHTASEAGVEVSAGSPTRVNPVVGWDLSFAESLTVTAASRQAERIVEAPAAVSLVTAEEVERQSAHGQLPRLLAASPGVELTQSGLFDFTLNSRGFNAGVVNNRVVVLIDGRDPFLPSVGAQEWAAVSFQLEELEAAEFVRGPGAALYGAGAFNGVLNLTTKSPRTSQGGKLRSSGGELDSRRVDLRYAGSFDKNWFYRLNGSYQESDNFTRSRLNEVEYQPALLPREPVPLPPGRTELVLGGLRFDKHLGARTLSLEVGNADIANTLVVTPAGRDFIMDSQRPWARFNINSLHWNLLGGYTERNADDRLLSAATPIFFNDHNLNVELQGHTGFAQGKGRLVAGASAGESGADSANPLGMQTLISSRQTADRQAVFGQVDYYFTDQLKGVFSGRWDRSDLHDSRFSPRGALVYSFTPKNVLRLTYADAFRPPNFSEFFFELPVAEPVDLSGLESALSPLLGGVDLGFEHIPLWLVGNVDLEIEKVAGFELGYNAILGRKAFLTLSYYKNELEDFTTSPLPQLGTSLGRINPNFGPYVPPAELPPPIAAIVLGALQTALPPELFAVMSNNPDGSPIFAVLSLTTFGRVDTEGVEVDLTYAFDRQWQLNFNYTFFDFDVQEEALENPLVPNTPENRLGASLSYVGERFDAALRYRWVDDFNWSSGVFVGPVESYSVVDLTLNYSINDRWTLGADIANALDEEHYEIFGGDLLRRRALAHVSFSW